jgi:hypothetical protein
MGFSTEEKATDRVVANTSWRFCTIYLFLAGVINYHLCLIVSAPY